MNLLISLLIIIGGVFIGIIIVLYRQMLETKRLKRKLREMLTNVLGSIDYLILTDLAQNTLILRDAVVSRDYITGYLPESLNVIQIKAEAQYPLQEYTLLSNFGEWKVGFLIGSFSRDENSDTYVFRPIIEADKIKQIRELPKFLETIAENISKSTEAKLRVLEDSLNVVVSVQKVMSSHIKDIVKFVGGVLAIRDDYIKYLQEGFQKVSGKIITEEELWKIIRGE